VGGWAAGEWHHGLRGRSFDIQCGFPRKTESTSVSTDPFILARQLVRETKTLIRGFELAKRVTELHPDICVIVMSGYSEDALVENQLVADRNLTLIQTPFDLEELAPVLWSRPH
jgi:hypothetical protein